jgi:hypothetical protein
MDFSLIVDDDLNASTSGMFETRYTALALLLF